MRIIKCIKAILLAPILLVYLPFLNKTNYQLIREDFKHLCEWQKYSFTLFNFFICFADKKEFRSIVYRRFGRCSCLTNWLLKGMDCLFICTKDIGGGLIIQHGFSTIINAKKIGKNCHIYQQVTIGYNGTKSPTIGDNVRICCGAKVIGGVHVGNNVVIGANAVVCKDVPDNVVVVGVPAKIIKHI